MNGWPARIVQRRKSAYYGRYFEPAYLVVWVRIDLGNGPEWIAVGRVDRG